MKRTLPLAVACGLLISAVRGQAAEPLRVLPPTTAGVPSGELLHKHLLRRSGENFDRLRREYEERKTPEAIAAHQERLKKLFVEKIGGFPERTPLNARTVGRIEHELYVIEKVLFESRPGHHVTANLYLPKADRFKAPYPAVLISCGHSANGKAYPSYQAASALPAVHGLATLIFDPICQGERAQAFDASGKPTALSTTGHTLIGLSSILLGENTARFEVWDAMRGLDYLQSRPEIDGKKLGAMGNSGGGTQTAYLMALDDRVAAGAPCCYITEFRRLLETIGPQDAEQNVFGQLEWGMNHADYLVMRAPRPTLICAATRDFFDIGGAWTSFRDAKRVYGRLGFAERVDLFETDAPHSYDRPAREASTRFMLRWLAGRDEAVTEPTLIPLADADLYAAPQGQVLKLPNERTAYDLNRDTEARLAAERTKTWADRPATERRAAIRTVVGLAPLDALPTLPARKLSSDEHPLGLIEKYALDAETDLPLPAVRILPKQTSGTPKSWTLIVSGDGLADLLRDGGPAARALAAGEPVVAVDLRGQGEGRLQKAAWYSETFGFDGREATIAYLLGDNLVRARASDLLRTRRWAGELIGAGVPAKLIAEKAAAIPALHAVALEPETFERVEVVGGLTAWKSLFGQDLHRHQAGHVIHGALRVYDLPDLVRLAGNRLTLRDPVDALGKPAP